MLAQPRVRTAPGEAPCVNYFKSDFPELRCELRKEARHPGGARCPNGDSCHMPDGLRR